jgi:hypothetical protein
MRELINLLDVILLEDDISEATLEASQINKYPERFDAFIDHIQKLRPFYTDVEGTEVVLDPQEADRFLQMKKQGLFKGGIKARDLDGQEWPISGFRKTAEFGGISTRPGEEGNTGKVKKEGAKLKPSQIGITGQPILASKLGQVIINNTVLQSTDYGRAVIEMAKQIVAGETAMIPPEFKKNDQIKKAIVDYAGEYLGVLALVNGQTDFPKQKQFLEWLGGEISSLELYFPVETNTPLADSYATVTNVANGHSINISSKGTGGGAAPSISAIKIPDHVREKKSYRAASELIELAQGKGLPDKSVSPVFAVMNYLGEIAPEAVPDNIKQYLPFPDDIATQVKSSLKNKTPMPEYEPLFRDLDSAGSDGGKLTYSVKKIVMKLVNEGVVPGYQEVVLEVLNYNFIQQYTNTQGRAGTIQFSTQWPAKLDGQVTLATKSGGTDPSKGGFSFKLQPAGSTPTDDLEMPDDNTVAPASAGATASDLDRISQRRTKVKPDDGKQTAGEKELGRKRRS